MSARSVKGRTYPVVGVLEPYMPGFTRFERFDLVRVRGLVWVRGDRLDILAIDATPRGRGHGGRFLTACQSAYATVGVWEITNPQLAAMLKRRGFRETREWLDGEEIAGMIWERTSRGMNEDAR